MSRTELDCDFSGNERFDVVRTLGSGGMGVVFEVIDRQRDVRVALKTLRHLDPRALYRFKREFRALHDIHHPNLVRIDELVEDRGQWFFTMELVHGVDFLTYVRGAHSPPSPTSEDTFANRPGDLRAVPPGVRIWPDASEPLMPLSSPPSSDDAGEATAIAPTALVRLRATIAQLANGLHALHEAGKIHRDIKPANVLVTSEGKVVLLDFGVVADAYAGVRETNDVFVGTIAYMAPEQAVGNDVGPAADWYALGAMLYEALTGQLPFDGSTLQVAMDKQRGEPPPPSSLVRGIPADLDRLCQSLLRCDPEHRAGRHAVLRCAGIAPPPTVRPRAESTSGWTLVGRETELAALRAAYDQVARGAPVTVLVTGESGIGKSALVREAAQSLAAGNEGQVALMSGRCYERESVPYKALDGVIDALAHFLRGLPDVEAAALLPPNAALLRRVFPVLGGVDSIARAPAPRREIRDPIELRERAFASLRQLLQLVCERYRTIVTIDDLQWADVDSLILLHDLLCPPDPPALLLLTSVRTDAAGALPELAHELPGEVRRIDLHMLDQAAAERLARRLLHYYRVPHVDAGHLAGETAGHPLYLGELVRHLAIEGSSSVELPRLDDAIWSRVQHLPSMARAVLELVCLSGGPLPRETARRAADLDEHIFADQVALLRAGHFVRGVQASDGLEPYHDRVREAVVRLMEPSRHATGLQRLAFALGTAVGASEQPDLLLYHLQLVGDTQRAAELTVSAAERAASALAFDRAAELYYAAIQLGEVAPARRRELTHRLAQTLVLAGRGPEAAMMFERAADGADPVTRLECLRLAAEQLLRSGHLDEGIAQLRALLTEVDLPYPATPRRALVSLLWQRARLRLRGRRWTLRSPREIADRDLLDADVCTSIGQTLGWVDTIRGATFQTRGLRLALDLGEPIRLGRALGSEAAYHASQGGRGFARGAALCGELRALADHSKVPYLAIYAMVIEGTCRYLAGDFAPAARMIREAEQMSQDELGNMYELAQARLPRLRSLRMLGAFTGMGEMFDVVVRDAERRGDRYSETSLRRCCSLLFLARDDIAAARDNLARATWTPAGPVFHVQHWFELEARAELALYEGAAASTLDEISTSLAAVDTSLLTRVQTIRVVAAWVRGRLLLGATQPDRPARHAEIRRCVRRLRRESPAYATVFARLLEAGIATCVRPAENAAISWRDAADAADAAELRVIAACARWRSGQVAGGDAGAVLMREAEETLAAAGVRCPERFVEVCAPGGVSRPS